MDAAFTLFGPAHLAAMALTCLAAWCLIRFYRNTESSPAARMPWNRAMAILLFTTVTLDPLLNGWRYFHDPAEAWRMIKEESMPIHLCDIVAILLGWALLKNSQRCAELGYLWGLSGTLQGLITPGLKYGFPAPEFFAFFLQHGGVPAVATGLAFGTSSLKPQKGTLWRAAGWINVYFAGIFLLNWMLGTNYGYVNHKPAPPTLMDFLGPWPLYLLSLEAVAVCFFLLLLLPLRKNTAASGTGKE